MSESTYNPISEEEFQNIEKYLRETYYGYNEDISMYLKLSLLHLANDYLINNPLEVESDLDKYKLMGLDIKELRESASQWCAEQARAWTTWMSKKDAAKVLQGVIETLISIENGTLDERLYGVSLREARYGLTNFKEEWFDKN